MTIPLEVLLSQTLGPVAANQGFFDVAACHEALLELAREGEESPQVSSEMLEAAADWALDLSEEGAPLFFKALARCKRFAIAGARVGELFDLRAGLDGTRTRVCQARVEAVRGFLSALAGPVEEHQARRRRKLEQQQRRRNKRYPLVSDLARAANMEEGRPRSLEGPARTLGPEWATSASEAAERVLERLCVCVAPRVYRALVALYAQPGKRPAYAVASAKGVSVKALGEAKRALVAISLQETRDLPPQARGYFAQRLTAGLGERDD